MTTIALWRDAWLQLGGRADDATFAQLCRGYSEPHRHYHTLQHLAECLSNVTAIAAIAERPAEVVIALWFHDAIYDVARNDNEARSATWARDSVAAAGLPPAVGARVHALILATQHVNPRAAAIGHADPCTDIDAQVLLDVDLWILGAPRARFDEYEQQVRREYQHAPEDVFQVARSKVLTTFLNRDHIFHTPYCRARLEGAARANLTRSIARLAG